MVLRLIPQVLLTKIIFFKKDFADWNKCYIFVEQNETTMTNTETIKKVGRPCPGRWCWRWTHSPPCTDQQNAQRLQQAY